MNTYIWGTYFLVNFIEIFCLKLSRVFIWLYGDSMKKNVSNIGRSYPMAGTDVIWDLVASHLHPCVYNFTRLENWGSHDDVLVEYLCSAFCRRRTNSLLVCHRIYSNNEVRCSEDGFHPTSLFLSLARLRFCFWISILSKTNERNNAVILGSVCLIICCVSDFNGSSMSSRLNNVSVLNLSVWI